jgi:hypothetical protein
MTNEWEYQGKTITEANIPAKAIGFLYIIQQLSTGRKYIGKKLLTFAKTKTVNKKKIKYRAESDWKDYWSSSPTLLELINEHGHDDFRRIILCFACSRSELNYYEESAQYRLGVLESDKWINSNIRSRIFKKNIIKLDMHNFKTALNTYSALQITD